MSKVASRKSSKRYNYNSLWSSLFILIVGLIIILLIFAFKLPEKYLLYIIPAWLGVLSSELIGTIIIDSNNVLIDSLKLTRIQMTGGFAVMIGLLLINLFYDPLHLNTDRKKNSLAAEYLYNRSGIPEIAVSFYNGSLIPYVTDKMNTDNITIKIDYINNHRKVVYIYVKLDEIYSDYRQIIIDVPTGFYQFFEVNDNELSGDWKSADKESKVRFVKKITVNTQQVLLKFSNDEK